ncbi:hypothetical protein QE152_g36073 [Popillia japonica]|uniref:Uncharacterized protein n=1 Tax=Popillia japonica TaxID=7064 RepID=A0AAW1IDU6_POPJA
MDVFYVTNYRGRAGYRGMGYRGGYRGGYRNQPTRRDLPPGGGNNINRPQIQTQPKTNNQTSTSASQPKTTTAPVTGK